MVIQSNLMAMNSYRNMTLNVISMTKSVERLSSGYRINSAADDPAGLAISEKMRAQYTAQAQALRNAEDASNLIGTAEGAMVEINTMLNRLTDLATSSANGTLSAEARAANQKEVTNILSEIDRISQSTNFNGIKLLDGSLSSKATSSVSISGVQTNQPGPSTAGVYTMDSLSTGATTFSAGDELTFRLTTSEGAVDLKLSVQDNGSGGLNLVSEGSNGYVNQFAMNADGTISNSTLTQAVWDQMSDKMGDNFYVSVDSSFSTITATSKELGSDAPYIAGADFLNGVGSTNFTAQLGVTADTNPTVDISNINKYDGTGSVENSIFSVNGSKFVWLDDPSLISDITDKDVTAISGSDQDLAAVIGQKTGLNVTSDGTTLTFKSKAAEGAALKLQIGETADSYNQMSVSIGNMSSSALGIGSLDVSTQEGAAAALSRINAAIGTVTENRTNLGALENRLEYTISSMSVAYENTVASESRIRDTDIAKEFMNYTKNSLLQQVSQAMLAHAYQMPSQILQLLQ